MGNRPECGSLTVITARVVARMVIVVVVVFASLLCIASILSGTACVFVLFLLIGF